MVVRTISARAATLGWSAIICALMAGPLAGPAPAARLEWSRGGSDLTIAKAERCTLDVAFTPEEVAALYEWRLVWVADGNVQGPVRAVRSQGAATPAEACDIRQDADGTAGARVDTAYFCKGASGFGGGDGASVRYVLDIPSAAPMRIAIVPVLRLGGKIRAATTGIAESRINGGCAANFPPVMVDVEFNNVGTSTMYELHGVYLDKIAAAHIYQTSVGVTIPGRIVSQSGERVEVQGPLLERIGSGLLEVRNGSGLAAIPIEWVGSGLERAVAPRLAVQLDRDVLSPTKVRAGESSGTWPIAAELADALTREGVVSFTPLFPEESTDQVVGATNLLGEPIDLAPLDDWFVAQLGSSADAAEVADRVTKTAGVRAAFVDEWRYLANLTPNDYLFNQQWGLSNPGGTVCGYASYPTIDIGATAAWDQTTGNPLVRVGILDSGVNPSHDDLVNRVDLGPNCIGGICVAWPLGLSIDDFGHGTSVAGIVAATGNNSTGIAGIGWQVRPCAIKVLDDQGGGYPSALGPAISWASHERIPILNMSLGWTEGSAQLGTGGHNLLADATLNAFKRGLFLVASSGNELDLPSSFDACPADLATRVYAVGAFLPNGDRWRDGPSELNAFDCTTYDPCMASNWGAWLDAMAPGGRLVATTALGSSDYRDLSGCITGDRSTMAFAGTSASAPFVSGIAGLLLSRHPELVGEDIAQILDRTAVPQYFSGGWTPEFGWGRVSGSSALYFVGPGKVIAHWGAGPGPFSLGALTVIDSTAIASRRFQNVPSMPSSDYTTSCVRYRLRATLTWPFSFATGLAGWTRSSGTSAWKDVGPYDYRAEVDSASFVPSTFGPTGATVEAFVFRVKNASNPSQTVGWFPTDPAHARVALTVIGYPAGTTGVETDRVAAKLSITTAPNPSGGAVKMALEVPTRGFVRGVVLDLAGRRVATLVDRELEPGRQEFWWDGRTDAGDHCNAGVYFCRVDCGGLSTTTRFIRLSGR